VEHALPYVMVMSGKLDGALELCVQALAQAKAVGDLRDEADVLFLTAALARQTGRLADAKAYLHETVELAMHVGYRLRSIDALEESGHWCAAGGQYAAAVTLWAARAAQLKAAGLPDTQEEIHRRQQPLREAGETLDAQQIRAAEERGAAMTLAAAV